MFVINNKLLYAF